MGWRHFSNEKETREHKKSSKSREITTKTIPITNNEVSKSYKVNTKCTALNTLRILINMKKKESARNKEEKSSVSSSSTRDVQQFRTKSAR